MINGHVERHAHRSTPFPYCGQNNATDRQEARLTHSTTARRRYVQQNRNRQQQQEERRGVFIDPFSLCDAASVWRGAVLQLLSRGRPLARIAMVTNKTRRCCEDSGSQRCHQRRREIIMHTRSNTGVSTTVATRRGRRDKHGCVCNSYATSSR